MPARTLAELPPHIASADNLPSVPGVALEVLRLSKDENAGIDEFADAIARDPALAAKLLKISNSSLFSLSRDVSTLQQATMVLGLKTVQLMSLSFSLASSLPRSGAVGDFEYSEYWRRSLVTSVAARSFCKLLDSNLGDEAFMCGLLSRIGQLVLVQCMPGEYGEVVEQSAGWPTLETENRILGFDHGAIGGALLKSWELPEIISTVVTHMHDPNELPDETEQRVRDLCWIMRMASLTEAILCDEDKGRPLSDLHEVCQKRGLVPEQLDGFLIGLESGIRETAELLDMEIDKTADHAELVSQAREQLVQISLGTAATLSTVERRAQHLENQNRELAAEASTDRLTGIANRAGFDAVLEKEVGARIEGKLPNALGLLMIDVDKFKVFNDTHGHRAGDKVLKVVGSVMRKLTRQSDLPARYGGEEFSVIVPQTTPTALKHYAERIRKTIESVPVPLESGETVSVTVSIGGACLVRAGGPEDGGTLVELADRQLYLCKENGRNQAQIAGRILNYGGNDA